MMQAQHNRHFYRRPKGTSGLRKSRFSLLELLIAMSILSIIIVMMLIIVSSSQDHFRHQEGRSRIYQNSRVAMEMLDRDFRSMVTSDLTGQEINYQMFEHDANDPTKQRVICFVASIESDDAATSRMCEVTYRFHTSGSGDSATRFKLQRQQVSDRYTDASQTPPEVADADWDFFQAPANWYNNSTTPAMFETLVDGVDEFTITFFDIEGNIIPPGNQNTPPNRAVITLVLFDPTLTGIGNTPQAQALRIRTKRAFTKIIYLGNINK